MRSVMGVRDDVMADIIRAALFHCSFFIFYKEQQQQTFCSNHYSLTDKEKDLKMATSPDAKKQKTLTKARVLMIGTGEYTTGFVGGQASDSDKGAGVVALTMFDLRRRGKVDRVGMCGVNVRNNSQLVLAWRRASIE
jgi:hypothetical protein